jgi:predicted DsbA family dithiol-disulfide isomerase
MPREGLDRRAYRSAKFGSWEKSQALDAQVTEAGASAGLVFRHDLMAKTPNTVASHALIRLAHETGDAAMQDRVVEALFSAYFTQGLDVGDLAVLADLAEGAGIERSRASAFLFEPASFDAVIDDEKLARGLGLNGVPSFVLGGNYLFSGAQPTSVMVRALREASAKLISAGQVAAPAEPPHAPA